MNNNMEVSIAGITLKNPVTTASGTFGSGREYSEHIDLNCLGGITVKVFRMSHGKATLFQESQKPEAECSSPLDFKIQE